MIYHTNRIACLINDKQNSVVPREVATLTGIDGREILEGFSSLILLERYCILLGWSGQFGGIPLLNHNLGWPWWFGHYNLAKRITLFLYIILENDEVYHELCTGKKQTPRSNMPNFSERRETVRIVNVEAFVLHLRFSGVSYGNGEAVSWPPCCLRLFVANLKQIKQRGFLSFINTSKNQRTNFS